MIENLPLITAIVIFGTAIAGLIAQLLKKAGSIYLAVNSRLDKALEMIENLTSTATKSSVIIEQLHRAATKSNARIEQLLQTLEGAGVAPPPEPVLERPREAGHTDAPE